MTESKPDLLLITPQKPFLQKIHLKGSMIIKCHTALKVEVKHLNIEIQYVMLWKTYYRNFQLQEFLWFEINEFEKSLIFFFFSSDNLEFSRYGISFCRLPEFFNDSKNHFQPAFVRYSTTKCTATYFLLSLLPFIRTRISTSLLLVTGCYFSSRLLTA